jgi:hypothetical protein
MATPSVRSAWMPQKDSFVPFTTLSLGRKRLSTRSALEHHSRSPRAYSISSCRGGGGGGSAVFAPVGYTSPSHAPTRLPHSRPPSLDFFHFLPPAPITKYHQSLGGVCPSLREAWIPSKVVRGLYRLLRCCSGVLLRGGAFSDPGQSASIPTLGTLRM